MTPLYRSYLLSVVLLLTLVPAAMASAPQAPMPAVRNSGGTVTFELTLPAYEITRDDAGFDVIAVPGFVLSTAPGEPMLPHRVYNVAVPPEADPDSLQVEIVEQSVTTLAGPYNLREGTPYEISVADGGDAGGTPPAYAMARAADSADFVTLLPPGQLRKWRFARLDFAPFRFDAETGELTVATRVSVRITYSADMVLSAADSALLQDDVMDDVAAELLDNYAVAAEWYQDGSQQELVTSGSTYDYVILTTNAIVAGSAVLDDFVAHKEGRGHSVLVVTESAYGSLSGPSPNGTAEKIRQWLKNNYLSYGIEYVLLIGNPNPASGDVPMKLCWPRKNATTYTDYRDAPTDAFYADLTGNWDLDGDGYYGEWSQDTATGGVDFANEVYVGRIPVYSAAYGTLDDILQKTIDYENELAPAAWRASALLPMSFGTTSYDGAPLAEQMMDDYLDDAGYASWTQYQQGSGACGLNSSYSSNQELRGGTVVRNRWAANDYGLVLWWGHGSETLAAVGCDGCWDGTLFSTSDATYLDDAHPAFVYQNSCLNGYPEYSTNLQYALLKNGAVTTVGATRVSWFSTVVGYGNFDGSPSNAGIGYEYAGRLTLGDQPAGKALANTRASLTASADAWLMNFYVFNLYGDPSTALSSTKVLQVTGTALNASGAGIANVTVGFGGTPADVLTDSNGYYSQSGFDNATYTVTFSKDGYTFSPQLTQITIAGDDVTQNTTGYRVVARHPTFSDDFESGTLGSAWAVETDYEGRVRVAGSYPHAGSWSMLLDDSVANSTYSHAAAVLPLNLFLCTDATLRFWWRGFGSTSHADDGVFFSDDDGETWTRVYAFSGGATTYQQVDIDLLDTLSTLGLDANWRFRLKFQFYGNEPAGTDGYAIDDVVTTATVGGNRTFLPIVENE